MDMLEKAAACRGGVTVFVCTDGSEFHTEMGPLDYLYFHGAATPDGRRIASYPHPTEGVDALSLALWQAVNDSIADAGPALPALDG